MRSYRSGEQPFVVGCPQSALYSFLKFLMSYVFTIKSPTPLAVSSIVGEADIQAAEVPVFQELPDDEILLAAE